ncbi:MAG: Calx-beta domain-containing protein, partial [Pseudomonadota bacterium]
MAKRLRNGRPLDDEWEDEFDVNRPDHWQTSALATLPSTSETMSWANVDANGRGGEDVSGRASPVAAKVFWGIKGPDKMDAGTEATFTIVRKGDPIWEGQEQSVRLVWGIRGDAELPQTLLDQIAAQLNAPGGPDGIRISRNRLYFSSEAPSDFVFTIAVDDDPDQTGDGFFLLGLRNASDGTIVVPNIEVKVVGDEGPPPADPSNLDVADAVAVDEGSGAGAPNVLRFVVDRTGDGNFADQEVSFEFETFLRAAPSQITLAIPDEDYISTSGTVTFGAGVTQVAIDVQIVGDLTPETDELVDFRISEAQGPDGTQIVGRLATGVILNDDEAPFPPSVFSVIDAEPVLEADPGDKPAEMVFRVIREGVDDFADTTASVNINTYRDLLGSLPQATPGEDYVSTGGTLTFAAGETERLVTVSVLGDSLVENNEEILVRLTNPVGQPGTSIDDGQARGVIVDDDTVGPSFITLSDAPATSEGDPGDNNSLVFEITRTGVGGFIDAPVSVDYTTWRASSSDGTPAQPREDFTPTFGVFTFAAGQTAGFITVGIIEDTRVEDNEVVLLRISDPDGPTGSEIVRPDALGVILDDDAPSFNLSRFSISDPQAVIEGDPGNPGEMVFEISRTGSGNFSNAP